MKKAMTNLGILVTFLTIAASQGLAAADAKDVATAPKQAVTVVTTTKISDQVIAICSQAAQGNDKVYDQCFIDEVISACSADAQGDQFLYDKCILENY